MDFNSAEFYQQMRDECYKRSLAAYEATDFMGEHQEVPILRYCVNNDTTPDELSFKEQKAIYDAAIDKAFNEAEEFAYYAEELDKQAYIKMLCELGLDNIPKVRN